MVKNIEMTNLDKLTKEIRSKIPELMEFKAGCLIKDELCTYIILDSDYQDDVYYQDLETFAIYHDYKDEIIKNCDIIGVEPKLQDVLNWIKIIRVDTEIDGVKELISITFYGAIVKDWDLSKPFLKNQSQELIDNLAGLIK